LSVFDTFDSRPPNETANHNDVGIVLSFGWSYEEPARPISAGDILFFIADNALTWRAV